MAVILITFLVLLLSIEVATSHILRASAQRFY